MKSDYFWEVAKKKKKVRKLTDEKVFGFTKKEAEKCRFKMVNQNLRLVECTVHRGAFSHGYRLHPPHLFDLRDGIIFHRQDTKSKWKRWYPNLNENLRRLKESLKEID